MAAVAVKGLDSLLCDATERYQLPGLSVAVSLAGRELYAEGFGFADPAGSRLVTPDTLFGIASVTKLATAALVVLLQQQGRLSLCDPVAKFFPGCNFAREHAPCLHHLLCHSAGLPGLPCRFQAADVSDPENRSGGVEGLGAGSDLDTPDVGILTSGDLVIALNRLGVHPLAPPGELLSYSNEGYCLLGGIIESAFGRPYREAVEELLFRPLAMSRSLVGGHQLHRHADVATPLRRDTDGLHAVTVWDAPIFYAAGGVVSTARDLIRLVGLLSPETGLLAPEQISLMGARQMPVASRPWSGIGYGYGLEVEHLESGGTLLWHTGQRAGISSFVARLREHGLSVALLSNLGGAPLARIGHEVVARLLGRNEIAWPPIFTPRLPDEADAARLIGRYGSPEGFEFRVEAQDGRLYLCSGGCRQPLSFADANSGTVAGQTFRFLSEDHYGFAMLALNLRVLPRLAAAQALLC